MTVKEQLMLLTKGYSKSEIDALKEAEKLENQSPKDEPKEEPKDEPKEEPKYEPPAEDPRDNKIKEMEEEIKRLQSDNAHRDISGGDKDNRTDFEKGVEIFRGKF